MNRVVLGIVLGIAGGLADLALMTATRFPGGRDVKMGAFSDRFLIGFFVATASLPLSPVPAGIVIGAMVSVPPALIIKEYAKIMISGIAIGALGGVAVRAFG
jgi:hypothetical protein